MDSVTQVLLGAAVGEAVAGRKLGNKAVLWGAISGTIPDLDVIGRYFLGTVEALDFHRGISHSIPFAIVVSLILGTLLYSKYPCEQASRRDWIWLIFLGMFTHALLDCFTTWGTQLFWSFDYRVAFKSIFVIDPLYTLPLLVCLLWLVFLPKDSKRRYKLNTIGLVLSSSYLLVSLIAKYNANVVFEASFKDQQLEVLRYDSRPAPLNTILWTVNAETSDGYYIGYYSFLDSDKQIEYTYFPKQHELLAHYNSDRVERLTAIMEQWYTVKQEDDHIILNDLRFGQTQGWQAEGDFVFAYKVFKVGDIVYVEEKEKNLSEGRKLIKPLWRRILGAE